MLWQSPMRGVRSLLVAGSSIGLAACPDPGPGPAAETVDGPGTTWRSPSGTRTLTWRATRWSVRSDRLFAELTLRSSPPAAAERRVPGPTLAWTLRDVIGPIDRGTAEPEGEGSETTVRLAAELPTPPPRFLALRLEPRTRPDSANWPVVHTPAAEAFILRLEDGEPRVPETTIPVWTGTIAVDGRLDEPGWQAAPVLTLSDSRGRPDVDFEGRRTRLRLAYDASNLYVGFEAEDPDVTDRHEDRDDPIYEHEAVELFLMPHVDGPWTGPYVELQASPRGVIFDASFTGPRRGMRSSWNGTQTVVSNVAGSLNARARDSGWTSEWKVPFDGLRWVRDRPQPGEVWRMNAFRIDRSSGLPDAHAAWSPPRVGDFHRVERFGFIRFGVKTATTAGDER